MTPVLGKEQLETGVHQRRCALIDDSIGVDLGPYMAESVDRLDQDHRKPAQAERGSIQAVVPRALLGLEKAVRARASVLHGGK